jgi:hypothetical protein
MPIILAILFFVFIELLLFADFATIKNNASLFIKDILYLINQSQSQMLPKVMFEKQLTATKMQMPT